MISDCSRNRSSLGWTSSGRSPISSRNNVPAGSRPHEAGLIGHGARERAAAMAEQLAVREVPPGGRAVVGQEHRGAPVRPDVDCPGDQLLARAALAGDEHGQLVALQPLDLLDDARHRRACREKPGKKRFERSVDCGRRRGASSDPARAHSANPWRATVAIIRSRRMTGWPIGLGEASSANRRPSASLPERLDDQCSTSVRLSVRRRSRQRTGRVLVEPGRAQSRGHHASREAVRTGPRTRPRHRRQPLRAARLRSPVRADPGSAAASTMRRTIASSASDRGDRGTRQSPASRAGLARLGCRRGHARRRAARRRRTPRRDDVRRPIGRRSRPPGARARDG